MNWGGFCKFTKNCLPSYILSWTRLYWITLGLTKSSAKRLINTHLYISTISTHIYSIYTYLLISTHIRAARRTRRTRAVSASTTLAGSSSSSSSASSWRWSPSPPSTCTTGTTVQYSTGQDSTVHVLQEQDTRGLQQGGLSHRQGVGVWQEGVVTII